MAPPLAISAPEYAWPVAAAVASLLIAVPLIAIAGANPFDGYKVLFDASFSSLNGVAALLLASVPLIIVGLGVALPLRVGLFNIGGEGQLAVGALAAVFVGYELKGPAGTAGQLPASAARSGVGRCDRRRHRGSA